MKNKRLLGAKKRMGGDKNLDGIQTTEVGKVWERKAEIKVILQCIHVAD